MSALKVLVPGHCNDCQLPHGRPSPNVALCFPCCAKRKQHYRMTTWRKYQTRWNNSPKGKIYKGTWQDQHRDRRNAAAKARHRKTYQPKPTSCFATACINQFIRPRGSHRRYCDECALAFYGKWYVRGRAKTVEVNTRAWRAA